MSFISQTMTRRLLSVLLLGGSAALLTGCVVAPAYPPGGYAPAEEVYAPMAPPPLQAEVIPVAPSPAYVWIGGSWGWSGGRYAWRPGRWAMPPRPGYTWHQRPWTQGPRGWHGGGGRWGRH